MIRFTLSLFFTALAWSVAGQPVLGPDDELRPESPWTSPVALNLEEGLYRLEVTGVPGPPPLALERLKAEGWSVSLTNETDRGPMTTLEWSVIRGDRWRVRPLQPGVGTTLRLSRPSFTGLKNTLELDLEGTPGLPGRIRAEFPRRPGERAWTALVGTELWVAWLSDRGIEVRRGHGDTPPSPDRAGNSVWTWLRWEQEGPVLVAGGPGGTKAWGWTGSGWLEEAPPGPPVFLVAGVTLRVDAAPSPGIWQASPGGWTNLKLPRAQEFSHLVVGTTPGRIYAFLSSTTRTVESWSPTEGWALLPPPVTGPVDVEGASQGTEPLVYAAGQDRTVTIASWINGTWQLGATFSFPSPVISVGVWGPSPWSATGTLFVVADRVTVYDLP